MTNTLNALREVLGAEPLRQWNAVDLAWVPVRLPDGSEQILTLREALTGAASLADIGTSLLPVERDALTRFVVSLTAAALAWSQAPARGGVLPVDAVDAFLTEHHDQFWLDDPHRPFLQEWHMDMGAAQESLKPRPLDEFHVHVVGPSTSRWGVRPEHRAAADLAVLTQLLVRAWFGIPSGNGAAPVGYRQTQSGGGRTHLSGAPMVGPQVTAFHLKGSTLAQTLLLNIPTTWTTSGSSPAYLNQDSPFQLALLKEPGSLWRNTWTPNRAVIVWDGATPTGFYSGTTSRPIPPVAEATPDTLVGLKACCKAVTADDYCRAYEEKELKDGTIGRIYAHTAKGARTTEGFAQWYRTDRDMALRHWSAKSRLLAPGKDTTVAFHRYIADAKGNGEFSEWAELPLIELTVPLVHRAALAQVLDLVENVTSPLNVHLYVASTGKQPGPKAPEHPLKSGARHRIYAALDRSVIGWVSDAIAGTLDVAAAKQTVARTAIDVFTTVTTPLATPATLSTVECARGEYATKVRTAAAKKTSVHKPQTAPKLTTA